MALMGMLAASCSNDESLDSSVNPSNEQTMNVTIETLDSDGNTIYGTVVENVPFKRNRVTKLTGSMYPTSASATAGSFLVNTDWLSEYSGTF